MQQRWPGAPQTEVDVRDTLILTGAVLTAATAGAVVVSPGAVGQGTAAPPASANVCANLKEVECNGKRGCSWLPGYRIAGGAEVPGYCRPAPRSINARRPGSEPQR
jgi:hypothetical protein